ncbi:MAG: hypothetical protein HY584_00715 [Candidatus Omnitrophica bacterium]|nr:hypothetical protein [Candidatus Omnitrophota bacterium]
MKIRERVIINENGNAVSVVLSIKDYRKLISLLADVVDSQYIAHHRKDPKRPFADFMNDLRDKGLV